MAGSPLASVLQAIDALDIDRVVSLFAPAGKLTRTDGECAAGIEQVRSVFTAFASQLRATDHRITHEWNPEPGVWIGEMTATYELRDYAELGPYRRAAVLREAKDGIHSLSFYGSHEQPIAASEHRYQEVQGAGGRWLPTL